MLPRQTSDAIYCPLNFGPIRSRRPVVVAAHNAHYYRGTRGAGIRLSLRQQYEARINHACLRAADVIIAVSNSLGESIRATLPDVASRVEVVYNGAPQVALTVQPVRLDCDRYILAMCGNGDHKRTRQLVEAWSSIAGKFNDTHLVLFGGISRANRDEILTAAGRYASRLHFLGYVSGPATMRWLYENAAIYVQPSVLESFSFTPLEALSVGCPVVASDIPVHAEILANSPARLVSISRLRDSLADMLEAPPDRAKWRFHTTWEDNARQTIDILRRVV